MNIENESNINISAFNTPGST